MTPPLCKDCAHFLPSRECSKSIYTDLVVGTKSFYSCTDVRSDTARCGPSGKWFEPPATIPEPVRYEIGNE